MGALAFVFLYFSITPWSRFYKVVPPLLLCYFIPALFNWPLNLVSPESSGSLLCIHSIFIACDSHFLCLSIDFAGLLVFREASP